MDVTQNNGERGNENENEDALRNFNEVFCPEVEMMAEIEQLIKTGKTSNDEVVSYLEKQLRAQEAELMEHAREDVSRFAEELVAVHAVATRVEEIAAAGDDSHVQPWFELNQINSIKWFKVPVW